MTTTRINPCTLALAITIALDATQQEVEDTIKRVRDFFDNGIAPTDINVQQQVSVAGSIPAQSETASATSNAAITDSTGMPWDERIHSSSKALTDKGVWRTRRNLDKAFLAKTEADIRASLTGAGRPSVEAFAASAPAAAAAIPAPPVQAALPALGGLPPLPGAAAVNPEYTALLDFISANSPPLTPEYISGNLPAFGIADGSLQTLAHNPDAIKAFSAALHTALGK